MTAASTAAVRQRRRIVQRLARFTMNPFLSVTWKMRFYMETTEMTPLRLSVEVAAAAAAIMIVLRHITVAKISRVLDIFSVLVISEAQPHSGRCDT